MSNDSDNDKIVSLEEKRRAAEEIRQPEKEKTHPSREPMVNLPCATKWLLFLIVGLHVLIHLIVPVEMRDWAMTNFGFVPARFSGMIPFNIWAAFSPITYMFLHGSWLHIIMNGVMLMAFGSGIERWLGTKRMLIFALLCGLISIATHFALNMNSLQPVVGASGALSGLFAAALIMLNRGQRDLGGRFGLMPFVILWIGISIAFGMTGAPDGSAIAWAAHIGGFLGGFAVLKLMRV